MGEGQTIQWQTDKRKNEQTMTYNTLHIKLRIDNEVEIHTALYICFIAYNFDSTHTKSLHRIILILSLYINCYLYSTINKLYLLVYQGNQMTYLKVYNLQTCNLLIYTNATSGFCFYFTNVKNFDKTEGTKSNSEIKQTNMSANINKITETRSTGAP